MIKVRLITYGGNYVTSTLIPPFVEGKEPGVIHWGNRTFTYGGWVQSVNGNIMLYVETFAYTVVENFFEEDLS